MKHLRFEELLLVSQADRGAFRLPLDPGSTVIKGANDTGKSSIVKELYSTLGATPEDVHQKWTDLRVISSLRFRIDNDAYRMIRAGTKYMLFDSEDSLVDSFTSVTNGLAPCIANMLNFRLTLPQNKLSGGESQATPAFLFMPFYIDQDAGWRTNWMTSFAKRQQFHYRRADVLKFHFGIRPSEWYSARAQLAEVESRANEVRREHTTLERVLDSLLEELDIADFSLDLDSFRAEVDGLLDRCRQLSQHEQVLRDKMAAAYHTLAVVRDQIEIARRALDELRADRHYSVEIGSDSIRCPTCHAEYDNGFAERFAIAVDEDRCLELLRDLDERYRSAEAEYERSRERTEAAKAAALQVETLLSRKRDNLVLQDVLRSEGRREMLSVVKRQLSDLSGRLGELAMAGSHAKERMAKYEDRKRSKMIQSYYRSEITRILDRLDVKNMPASSYKTLGAKIRDTGSDVPRAVLGIFLAGLRTIHKFSTCAFCPVVIDSPNQQDQDKDSWELICEAIRDEMPEGSQLVIAGADDEKMDFGGSVMELETKRRVLDPALYEEGWAEIAPLYELAIRSD